MAKKQVVIGLYGAVLDWVGRRKRWQRWRPTVSLFQHQDFVPARLELLVQEDYLRRAQLLVEDIQSLAPHAELRLIPFRISDPWDLEEFFTILLDFAKSYPFDTEGESYLVHITTGTHVAQICLFLLTESGNFPGALIQTSPPGKDDPERRPRYQIIDLDLSKYDAIASRFHQEKEEDLTFLKSEIETRNASFNALIEQIEKVAIRSRAPLLLQGPTGAGKSQLAKRVFELKKLKNQISGSFVEVNCATLRGDTAMSTLFGHVRGAFTGAQSARSGLLKMADQGLLFLDEIGELGQDEQAMLLRAVEEKSFFSVGADTETASDFQLLAGTNRDLFEDVARGRFREDLLARINLWTFELPGLADRKEDIEPNIRYELDKIAQREGRAVSFNKEALRRYLKFGTGPEALWTGNFRDLNASIVRMVTLTSGARIDVETVDEEMERLRRLWRPAAKNEDLPLQKILDAKTLDRLDLFERIQLRGVLAVCSRCHALSEAGRHLFAISRTRKKQAKDADRPRKYLAKFGLTASQVLATRGN